MPTNFPGGLDTPHDPVAGESEAAGAPGDLAAEITNLNDRTVAMEAWLLPGGAGDVGSRVQAFATSIGDGATLTYTVAHNLATTDVAVTVRDLTVGDIVYPTVDVVDTDHISITFGTAPTTNEMRILVGAY